MKLSFSVFVVAVSLLSGCAFKTSPYGASASNVEAIKTTGIKSVSVGKFQSTKPGLASITCRAAGPVTVEPSFESYIELAFVTELKLAGVYNPNSTLVLTGKLEEIDFSSGMTDGNWRFVITVSNSRSESFSTTSTLGFSGSFLGDRACAEVAQAFLPAVQKLIGEVVRDPKFKQIAR